MKIGIDLDNTIISYDVAFRVAASDRGLISDNYKYTKQELSKKIKNRKNGELEWQRLQGYVYGRGIKKANLFPGVYRFLWRCFNRGITVEIVSHKTEYGHFDKEKHSLRQAAIEFLCEHGVLGRGTEDNNKLIYKVTFADTQQDKIDYISRNGFDYFVDDLEVIVNSKQLAKVKTILFNGEAGYLWDEINDAVLGGWIESELLQVVNRVLPDQTVSLLEKIEGRGNSEINKIVIDGERYICKIYPQSGDHNRLVAEYNGLKLLKELSIPYLQTPVSYDGNLGVAIYDYIDGKKDYNYNAGHVKQMLSLLSALNTAQVKDRFSSFNFASNACLSGLDVEVQIKNRLKTFNCAIDKHLGLKLFMYDEFIPALNDLLIWSKKNWPKKYTESLSQSELVLSPSDFGFHNAIEATSGRLIFYDFEYFGWDDPVKLIADVLHHAAFDLSAECEQLWVNGCVEIYGESILERYRAAWPLYGLLWCLIILNEYNNVFWQRRVAANGVLKYKKEDILVAQLDKAKKQLNRVMGRYDKI